MSYKAKKTLPERITGIAVVVLFHVVIIYLLLNNLGHNPLEIVTQQIDAKIIEEEAPPAEEAPPPPPPDFVPPPPDFVPPPDIEFTADAPPPANANAITVSKKPVEEVKTTGARPPKKGLSRPAYPAASTRLGEEGSVSLALYLDETGKVREAKVDASSGFERLDEAAVKHAVRAWKFEPCMKGTQPVACWHRIKFRFKLDEK